jgi:hypothetical protein
MVQRSGPTISCSAHTAPGIEVILKGPARDRIGSESVCWFHWRPTPRQAALCVVSNRLMHPGHALWFLCAWGT